MTYAPQYGGPWRRIRAAILERDRHRCHWCGAHATTVDHVVPLVEGGTHDPANLVAACRSCNMRRGGEWLQRHRPSGWHRARARARSGGILETKRDRPENRNQTESLDGPPVF